MTERDLAGARVMVTGGAGFLGSRVVADLRAQGAEALVVRSADYDLRDPVRVRAALDDLSPSYVVHCAAVVGGIGANRARPGEFFYANAVMGIHLIHEAWRSGVEKMVVVGTVCSYPKHTAVPFREDELWEGYPEETNAPYGLAKKMQLVQAQAYRQEYGFNCVYVIPTNLYGPGDNVDPGSSHVIPAIISRCLAARANGSDEVELWGTGSASREFLFVDDAARAVVLALGRYDAAEPVNLGVDQEITIRELAERIAALTGFSGRIVWNDALPDGQPRRRIDATRARTMLGWSPTLTLDEGLRLTIEHHRSL